MLHASNAPCVTAKKGDILRLERTPDGYILWRRRYTGKKRSVLVTGHRLKIKNVPTQPRLKYNLDILDIEVCFIASDRGEQLQLESGRLVPFSDFTEAATADQMVIEVIGRHSQKSHRNPDISLLDKASAALNVEPLQVPSRRIMSECCTFRAA